MDGSGIIADPVNIVLMIALAALGVFATRSILRTRRHCPGCGSRALEPTGNVRESDSHVPQRSPRRIMVPRTFREQEYSCSECGMMSWH